MSNRDRPFNCLQPKKVSTKLENTFGRSSAGEEEKLFQMVHDFIESPPPVYSISSLMNPSLNDHQSKHVILQEVLRCGSGAESEVVEKVLKHLRKKMDAKRVLV